MMTLRRLYRMSRDYNLSISGMKGAGKDVLIGNMLARYSKGYVSNMDYTMDHRYHPLNLDTYNIPTTTAELISGQVVHTWEVPPDLDGLEVWVSDCGVVLPSHEDKYLSTRYGGLPKCFALSRQIIGATMHYNSQQDGRVWVKLREQSERYVRCNKCIFFGPIVLLTFTTYTKRSSVDDNVPPYPVKKPPLTTTRNEARMAWELAKAQYDITYGEVNRHTLLFINKSKHNTNGYRDILKGVLNNVNTEKGGSNDC